MSFISRVADFFIVPLIENGNFYKYCKIIKKSIGYSHKSNYICVTDNNNTQ